MSTPASHCSDVGTDLTLSADVGVGFLTLPIFVDGFESGDTSAWSNTVP